MVSVLIPAYNEADRIARTIESVRQIDSGGDIEVIVVDDGSVDGTAEAAEHAGATRVLRQTNQGKGAALRAAAAVAAGEILLLLDADLGETAGEAGKLLEPITMGAADMAIATFPVRPGRGGGAGLVVRLARWGIHGLTGRVMLAPLSGQRAIRREVLEGSGAFADGWGVEIALTVRALWHGYRLQEVPTEMDHRVTGRDAASILHRAAQFRAVLAVLIRLFLQQRREARVALRTKTGDG